MYTERSLFDILLKGLFCWHFSLTLGFRNCRIIVMSSLGCYVPVTGNIFSIPLMDKIPVNTLEIPIDQLTIDFLKIYIWEQKHNILKDLDVNNASRLDLWRVNVERVANVVDVHTEDDIVQKLEGNKMDPSLMYSHYFNKTPEAGKIHIIISRSSTSECLLIFYFSKKDNFAILFSI